MKRIILTTLFVIIFLFSVTIAIARNGVVEGKAGWQLNRPEPYWTLCNGVVEGKEGWRFNRPPYQTQWNGVVEGKAGWRFNRPEPYRTPCNGIVEGKADWRKNP